jgi:predicted nucleic acid-binding protein
MPLVTFDTLVFISYKPAPARFPAGFRMSVVVLQELIAGATDKSELNALISAGRDYEEDGRLLTPEAGDWIEAGRVLNSLQRGRRSHRTGQIPKMSVEERVRIINDVLIARTAKRAGVAVVTDNLRDFEKIRSFCNVLLIRARDYFRNR